MGRWLEWVRVERVDGKMYTCMYGIDLEQGGGRGESGRHSALAALTDRHESEK